MKKIVWTILFTSLIIKSYSQSFLNGDFEINSADSCLWNVTNNLFSSFMSDVIEFGGSNEVDIQKNGCSDFNPQSGNYFISLNMSGRAVDAVALKLSSSLIKGRKYLVSYFDRAGYYDSDTIEIGLSNSPFIFGTLIYRSHPVYDLWIKETFSFTASQMADYITVKLTFSSHHPSIDNFHIEPYSANGILGKDTILCTGQTLMLHPDFSGASYKWQDGSNDSTYTVTKDGVYIVNISANGFNYCDSIKVNYYDCSSDCQFYVPDIFSPNNDGINDDLIVKSICYIKNYQIIIFNRWGEKIFESNDISRNWDGNYKGKPVEQSCYYYQIVAITASRPFSKTGIVHLMR